MPRPRAVARPVKLNITLPEDIRAKLDLELFSSVEGCVPRGAYRDFFIARIREYFERKQNVLP